MKHSTMPKLWENLYSTTYKVLLYICVVLPKSDPHIVVGIFLTRPQLLGSDLKEDRGKSVNPFSMVNFPSDVGC
jgi:hypothetical protein